jgi:ribonuclease HI
VQVVVHVDGGARGNPGPAAAAAVVSDPDGRVLDEAAVTLGHATNNVAEYRGLLLGLERAEALGATEVEVINDSELIAKQVNGEYKVKHADLVPLHARARAGLEAFERWSVRSVPRAQNAAADALVNRALDGVEAAPAATAPERADDEPLLGIVQEADEQWLGLIVHELTAARDALAAGRPHAAAPRLRRVVAVWRLLLTQLEVLETLGPERTREDPPAAGSGGESRRLRAIEWISGERRAWEGGGDPPAGASLYEAFAGGLGLPEEREARLETLADLYRDHARDAVRAAWHDVAELLLDHDEWAARWRHHRVLTTARRIRTEPGAGHTWDRRFFPELWDVRPKR